MADKPVFLFLGVYDNPVVAQSDLETVRELHDDGVIGTYDAAVAVERLDGWVSVEKYEKPTQHGAWTGVAVGRGRRHPLPALAHRHGRRRRRRGRPHRPLLARHDPQGRARSSARRSTRARRCSSWSADDKLAEELQKADLKAQKQVEKEIDMEGKDLEQALADAEKELA